MISTKTIKRLESLGIPVKSDLPSLEGKKSRTAKDVATRVNILGMLIAVADDKRSLSFFKDLLSQQGMNDFLTEKERSIFEKGDLTKQEEINWSWSQESLYALSWSLGLFSAMRTPTKEAPLDDFFKHLPPEVALNRFIDAAQLIDFDQIVLETEFYYALHWAKRHPESWNSANKLSNKDLLLSAIMERRKALEWLIDDTLEWDDISLDT